MVRRGHRLAWAVVALAVPLVCGGTTFAAQPSKKVKSACASDYKRLCPNYKVGTPQLRACMESYQSDISQRCIDALVDSGEVDGRRARR